MQQQSRGYAVALVLLVLCSCCQHTQATSAGWRYAVIIDAGSTGSRAHVFRYHTPAPGAAFGHAAYPEVDLPEAVLKATPGLSSYAHDPPAAAKSLGPLIKFAKDKVPPDQWHHTPIQLMATAGVRMLRSGSAKMIMAEVKQYLFTCGFDFSGARVLTGTEEGLLGWVALNYATGALQAASAQKQPSYLGRKDPPTSRTTTTATSSSSDQPSVPLKGVLELGGGSLQVTFLPEAPLPSAEASPLALPNLGSGRLYSRSFDGLGLQAAMAQWASSLAARRQSQDPCLPVGFKASSSNSSSSSRGVSLLGSGNWQACKAAVASLLPKESPCLYKMCGIAGSFLPAVEGATFVGVDNFYYTASALGLSTSKGTSLDDFDKAAGTLCASSWSHIKAHYLKNHKGDPADSYHAKVCFSSALIIGLLKDGLHLTTNAPLLTASNSITTPQGKALEAKWPLGALVIGLLQSKGAGLKDISLNPKPTGPLSKHLTPKHHRTHDHPMLGAGQEEGLSAGSAALVAVLFCLSMLALTLALSWVGVGLPGNGRCGLLWQRAYWTVDRTFGGGSSSSSGAGGGGGGLGGGGVAASSTSVKYMRVRAVSRGPRSRSPSPDRRGVESQGPGGSVMLTVLPLGAEVTPSAWAAVGEANGFGGSSGSRPLTARQR